MTNSRARSSVTSLILITGSFITVWIIFSLLPAVFEIWSLQTGDYLFQLRHKLFGKRTVHSSVIHLDIDDSSIEHLPYSVDDVRLYAELIGILSDVYVSKVAIDMVFPKCYVQEDCQYLKDSTRNSDNVYLPLIVRTNKSGLLFPANKEFGRDSLWFPKISNYGEPITGSSGFANFSGLDEAAKGVGHINCSPDRDGVYRRFPLLIRVAGGFVPSLAFRVVCDYLKVDPDEIEVGFGKEIVLRGAEFPDGRVRDIAIPIDESGRITINFAGPWNDSFFHYSIADLFSIAEDPDKIDLLKDEFENSIVFIGDISTGGRDLGPMPIENIYPLIGFHSNIVNSILLQDFLRELSTSKEILLNLLVGLILFGVAFYFRGTGFTLSGILVLCFFIAGAVCLFFFQNTIVNIARTSIGIITVLCVVNIQKYILQEREKVFMRAKFENYIAPEVLSKILKSPQDIGPCQKKKLTILFSDIAGFTSWCASQKPEDIHRTLNEYFEEMSEIIFRHGGTIDKYIGDGLLVFFGDPIDQEDHSLRAVSAAIDMQKKAMELKTDWEKKGGMPLEIRIGINTGDVVVGNMGSEKRLDYTVIGANVNLAQRLESNAPLGGILVSEAVFREISDTFIVENAGKIKAKGFSDEIEVFEVKVH